METMNAWWCDHYLFQNAHLNNQPITFWILDFPNIDSQAYTVEGYFRQSGMNYNKPLVGLFIAGMLFKVIYITNTIKPMTYS